jgi:hypothetical protein
MSVRQNVRSAKRPSAKCPFGKMSFGKMSFGKMSFGKVSFGKLMSGHRNCLEEEIKNIKSYFTFKKTAKSYYLMSS